jgi:ELWxxDGT repeat protein
MIKDIYPGVDKNSGASYMVGMNGKVFFGAVTAAEGHELWSTDGTEAGTVMVKDIRPFIGSSSPQYLTVAENQLFFTADDGSGGGIELWRSDGTGTGTIKVSTLTNANPLINALIPFGSNVLFGAQDSGGNRALWISNGSPGGTTLVKDFMPGNEIIWYAGKTEQYTFWLVTNNSWGSPTSLWRTDGTPAGTIQIFNYDTYMPYAEFTTTINNVVYFSSDHFPALWRTDGTSCGTYMASTTDVWLQELAVLNGTLFFQGIQYDETTTYSPVGEELYSFTPSVASPCMDEARVAQAEEVIPEDAEFVSAFPNPSRTQFNVSIAGKEDEQYQIEVLTVNGKKVESHQELSYNRAYQFGGTWGMGVYIMKVYANGKMVTRKLIKTN